MKDDRVNLKGKIKDAELYHAKLISQGDVVSALGVRARISDLTKQYERLKGDIGSTRKKSLKQIPLGKQVAEKKRNNYFNFVI